MSTRACLALRAVAVIALILGGCVDESPTFPERNAGDTIGQTPSLLNRASPPLQERDIEAIGRFDITVDIASGARIGEAIRLTVRTTARVFDRMRAAAGAAQQLFGQSRPQIKVMLTTSGSNSYYSKSQDRIYIKTNASPDHIWGSFGDFVIPHEYGHAFHHKALGGINSNSGVNCNPHTLDGPSSLGCAMAEGFADYFAAATLGAYANFFENSTFYPGGDGSVIEGPVAAFLYDLTDPANEPHDSMNYPGSYVGAIFNSCLTYSIGLSANGIDHIIYCLENQVDPAVVQNYFPARAAKIGRAHV